MFGDRLAADTRVLEDSTYFVPADYIERFRGEVRGKQTKGPTVKHKHKSSVESSSDEEDFEVDNNTSGPIEEGDPTDGLREAVAAIT